jgi:hypothetical protein
MQVAFHQGLYGAKRANCTRLVLYDQFNQPLMAAVEQGPGHYWLAHRNDPEWQNILASMGVTDTVISETILDDRPASPRKLLTPSLT